jgi:hypothetical protein
MHSRWAIIWPENALSAASPPFLAADVVGWSLLMQQEPGGSYSDMISRLAAAEHDRWG